MSTNVERFLAAGLLDAKAPGLTPDEVQRINDELSSEEVDAIISASQKLGVGPSLATVVKTQMY